MDAIKRLGHLALSVEYAWLTVPTVIGLFVLSVLLFNLVTIPTEASGALIGSAFKHEDNALRCGTPTNAIVWSGPSKAEQHFQRCGLVARYATVTPVVTPATKPVITALPTLTALPSISPQPIRTATPGIQPTAPVTSDPNVGALLTVLNTDRAQHGVPPLSLVSDATTQQHALDMRTDGTIWHVSAAHPATSFPYGGFTGENVGAGQTVQQVEQLFMSEGTSTCSLGTISHACNIVSPYYRSVSIGIAYGLPYGEFIVQDFR